MGLYVDVALARGAFVLRDYDRSGSEIIIFYNAYPASYFAFETLCPLFNPISPKDPSITTISCSLCSTKGFPLVKTLALLPWPELSQTPFEVALRVVDILTV